MRIATAHSRSCGLAGTTGVVATLALLLAAFSPARAADPKHASMVIDADSGAVLQAVNPDVRNPPASLTKMMTLFLVFEGLRNGKLSPRTPLAVSARAAGQPPSRLGLQPGQSIAVEDAILGLVTKSANDVALVVAEGLAGSESEFALAMTAKARKLGMRNTTFRNASGLPHDGQMSTARDMAILARALIKQFPNYYPYFGTETFPYGGTTHVNHNRLLFSYDGADGIKTGYIRASGFNLVASAKRGERRLIGVVFGATSSAARNEHMAEILDRAFAGLGTAQAKPRRTDPKTRPPEAEPDLEMAAALAARPDDQGSRDQDRRASLTTSANEPELWGVQVGAYRSADPARAAARKAVAAAPALLGAGEIRIEPLETSKRRALYRARILRITKEQAYKACRVLKGQGLQCMEMQIKGGIELTTAG